MSNDTPSIWVARLPYSSMLVHLDNIVDRNTSILVRHIRHLSKICRPLNSFTYLNLYDSIIYIKVILNIMTGVHLCQLRYTYVFFIQTATFFLDNIQSATCAKYPSSLPFILMLLACIK